jgi:hypothetical protein
MKPRKRERCFDGRTTGRETVGPPGEASERSVREKRSRETRSTLGRDSGIDHEKRGFRQ